MNKREIIKRMRLALERATPTHDGSFYGRGLASEGYIGGYRDALCDALLLLQSDTVPDRRDFWPRQLP